MKKKRYTQILIVAIILIIIGTLTFKYKDTILNQNDFNRIVIPNTPHIITKDDYIGTELKPEFKVIEEGVRVLLLQKYGTYYDYILLKGYSKNFVVITVATMSGGHDELINMETGEILPLGNSNPIIVNENMLFYTDFRSISYYSLGSSKSIVLPNSQLKDNETYSQGTDMFIIPEYSLSTSTITISVFDSTIIDSGLGTPNYKYKKLRTETFDIPR